MRIKNLHKRGLAGILIVLFLNVFLVKDFHTHGDIHACGKGCSEMPQQPDSDDHHHSDCFVCKFLFSAFIEKADITTTISQTVLFINHTEIPEIFTVPERFTFNLRAPPYIV